MQNRTFRLNPSKKAGKLRWHAGERSKESKYEEKKALSMKKETAYVNYREEDKGREQREVEQNGKGDVEKIGGRCSEEDLRLQCYFCPL